MARKIMKKKNRKNLRMNQFEDLKMTIQGNSDKRNFTNRFFLITNNLFLITCLFLFLNSTFLISHCFAQNIAINESGTAANGTAILDVQPDVSLNKGLLIPRLTTAQQSAISSPAQSLLIYNTTDSCFEAYIGTVWIKFGCAAGCTFPAVPTAGTNTPSQAQIVWNWNASAGATAYYYNTVNNFNTATSNGASTSYTQYSLACNTTFTLYVWASNGCGRSNPVTLTQTTLACGPSCGTQIWATANLNVGTYVSLASWNPQPSGDKWCYNNILANCTTYGGLYDWSNAMNLPGADNGILVGGAWQTCDPCGAGGKQGICPSGYHIPTDLEWSRYEYCIENNIAPAGTTTLATFQTTTGLRGSTLSTAGVYQGPGAKMKTATGNPWADGTFSNNLSGFAALPSGWSCCGGTFSSIGTDTGIHTATESSAGTAWNRGLGSGSAQSDRWSAGFKSDGYLVRCLHN